MDKQYDFISRELEIQKFWQKNGIFKFDPDLEKEVFSIDTPPPTVSGQMHIGHSFSYTQQDIVARFARLANKNVFYPFGTDDNGLPTERLIEKLKNVRTVDMKRSQFIELCQKTLQEILPDFIQDWKDIGMSCDFDLYYSTIDDNSRRLSQQSFIDLYKMGRAYRIEAPVVWCPTCRTAISQMEMEDRVDESKFCDLTFKLDNGEELIISTTRPELLSSCVAIFVNPQDERYQKIVNQMAQVPIFNHKVKVIADSRAEMEKGTGAAMCCTFGDATDMQWYRAHKLPLILSIDQSGHMTDKAGKYKGMTAKEAREAITSDLKVAGLMIGEKKITHNVNVHERCKTQVEIINSKQWFIKYLDLKEQFLSAGNKLNWYPDFMKSRLENWIKGLQWDWCISRQRFFGVPFPLWYCKNCGKVKLANVDDLPVDPIKDKPKTPCDCGSNEFEPEIDVLDTWATSSLTPQIAISLVSDKVAKDKLFPMSLRPQAHDIISFWLFNTLVKSLLHENKNPWRDVMISGWVLDPKGRKMSKSLGNVIEPKNIIKSYGADAIRYWACGAALGQDISFTEEEIRVGKKTVLKLWNAARFCKLQFEQNLFTPDNEKLNLEPEDEWIISRLIIAVDEYKKSFKQYNLPMARAAVDKLFWDDFADNYLEIIKERVYGQDEGSKHAALNTLYSILFGIVCLYSPIIAHVSEKIYDEIYKRDKNKESISQFIFGDLNLGKVNKNIVSDFEIVKKIISKIRKYKSEHQLSINAPISKVTIQAEDDFEAYFSLIKSVSNAKSVTLGRGNLEIEDTVKVKIS